MKQKLFGLLLLALAASGSNRIEASNSSVGCCIGAYKVQFPGSDHRAGSIPLSCCSTPLKLRHVRRCRDAKSLASFFAPTRKRPN
jgi:hypothetical protein